ncbi:MAG: glycosyltransferase [Lachnospiraceae bacterium]|nr:glycosyltransferase [Lachnospiraceae bacterium]
MIKKDLISVIIPVHNGQDYLMNCVNSILEQQNPRYDLEIIIVNDGSTDHTGIICENIKKEYDIIRIITMEDLGVSCARNAGLDIMNGDFVTFVDADDRLISGALKHMYEMCNDGDFDFAGIDFFTWHSENDYDEAVKKINADYSGSNITYKGFEYLDKGILSGDCRCWGKIYRRSSIGRIRFEKDLSIGEDMLFLLDVVSKSTKLAISGFSGYGYFINPGGLTLRTFNPEYMDRITCWQKAYDRIALIRPDLNYRTAANIMVSVMLTVGKIAILPKKVRNEYLSEIKDCQRKLREAFKVSGAYHELSFGYKIKVRLFALCPRLYINLYYLWKYRKNN